MASKAHLSVFSGPASLRYLKTQVRAFNQFDNIIYQLGGLTLPLGFLSTLSLLQTLLFCQSLFFPSPCSSLKSKDSERGRAQ
jgi:hypothetical protein